MNTEKLAYWAEIVALNAVWIWIGWQLLAVGGAK